MSYGVQIQSRLSRQSTDADERRFRAGLRPQAHRCVGPKRTNQIDPETATGRAKALLGAVKDKLGLVPNMTCAMANVPAVLDGFLQLSGSLSKGTLSARDRKRVSLAVAQANGSDYCLAAHSALGRMAGLTADQIRDSRLGIAVDPKADALVRLALKVVEARGRVGDGDLDDARAAGFETGPSRRWWRTSRSASSPITSTTSPRRTSTSREPRN